MSVKPPTRFNMLPILLVIVVIVVCAVWWKISHKRESLEARKQEAVAQAAQSKLDEQRRAFDAKLEKEKLRTAYDKSVDALLEQQRRWIDAHSLADNTPRVSLPGPIAKLQEVRRETAQLVLPECLSEARQHLVLGMDQTIDGFLAFLGNRPSEEYKRFRLFADAEVAVLAYRDAMKQCGEANPARRVQ